MKREDQSVDDNHFMPMVVVPTFNHGTRVFGVIDGLRSLGLPIIVVDDGSTDGTGDVLHACIENAPSPRIEVCRHRVNRGKAAALRTGFETAQQLGATHVATIDADGQLDPADIPALMELARRHPRALVLGERPARMPGCPARCAAGRRTTSLAVRAQCGLRITDSQCGLRVYPLELVRSVRCRASRYSFEAEIITRAVWAGFDVVSMPIHCRYLNKAEQVSHYRPWIDTLRQAAVHLRLLMRAMIPVPHQRLLGYEKATKDDRRWWPRFVAWVNPMRCLREARSADLGRMELAAAIAIGVWIGTTPFFGFHVLICLYFAWRLHLHPAPMLLGSQVSMPPLGVLLAIASTAVGNLLLTGHGFPSGFVIPTWTDWPAFAWRWMAAWLLGSMVLGGGLALCAFWTILAMGSRRDRNDATASNIDQLLDPDKVDPSIAHGLDHSR